MSAAAAAARDAVANAASTLPAGLWETGRSGSGASSAGGGGGGSGSATEPLAAGRATSFPAGLRVLVVDDDPCCLKVVEAMLRRCGQAGCGCVSGADPGARPRPCQRG